MKCTNPECKSPNKSDALYCHNCGEKLSNVQPLPQRQSKPPKTQNHLSDEESVLCKAVKKINSDIDLGNVAKYSKYESVALAAINELSIDNYIYEVAKTTKYESVALAAINKLSNDYYIYQVAMSSKYKSVWLDAVQKMTDGSYIQKIIRQKFDVL